MIGKNRITEKEREVLRGLVNHTCQECLKHEYDCGELQAHRIITGDMGGKYCPNNIKMICSRCHDMFTTAHRMASGR